MNPTLAVIGLNFQSSPAAIRERFWISGPRRREALLHMVRSEGIDEAVVLATGNRTEFILWASDVPTASNSVLRFLTQEYGLTLSEWSHFYRLMDDAALLHIFRVAASLDALTMQEPDILGDITDAWTQARQAGCTGRFLDSVLQQALTVANRVHTEVAATGQRALELGAESAREAERILAGHAHGFLQQLTAGNSLPAIAALRRHLDKLCREELEVLRDEFGPFTADQEQALTAFAHHVTQRIASSMARELKEFPDRSEPEVLCAALRRLFGIEPGSAVPAGTRH